MLQFLANFLRIFFSLFHYLLDANVDPIITYNMKKRKSIILKGIDIN